MRRWERKLRLRSNPIINSFQSIAWVLHASDWTAVNDFETVVFHQHPQLKSIKGKLLKLGAWRAMMTGSGSALFGLFASRETAGSAPPRLFRKEFQRIRSIRLQW